MHSYKEMLKLVLYISMLVLFVSSAHGFDRSTDSLALIALYDNTNGDNWNRNYNWKTSSTIDTWYGVTVVDDRVTKLDLDNRNITGVLPPEIGNFDQLQYINFRDNNISGALPDELGNLSNLTILYISRNEITALHNTFGGMTSLEKLDICFNNISGPLPESLGNCTNLWYCFMNSNQFTGVIPSSFANLSGLINFGLKVNQLSGEVPSFFGNFSNLEVFEIRENNFTDIGNGLVNLTTLVYLGLDHNKFCNLTPALEAWADTYDPDWASTQVCNQQRPDLTIINQKDGSSLQVLEITPQGNLTTTVVTKTGSISAIEDGALTIEKVPNTATLSASTNKIQLEGFVMEDNISDPADGDLSIDNRAIAAQVPQATLNPSSGLSITGALDSRDEELVFAVAYVDNSVYEQGMNDPALTYKYTNFGSDGKSFADNSFHYYIKDHLGSTRRVVTEAFEDVEVLAYKAYGEQITLKTSSDEETRDNFTGKELDKEGKYSNVEVNLEILGLTGSDLTFTINFNDNKKYEIKPELSRIDDDVTAKFSFVLSEERSILSIGLTVPDNNPAIDYTETFTDEVIEPGSDIVVALSETAQNLNDGTPAQGFDLDKEEDAYVGMGLNYFGSRYYDADIGRWISTDPQEQFDDFYSYTGGNPIIMVDPDGEAANIVIGAASSVAIGWGIAKLTGQEYGWGDAAIDAATGAACVGIFSKARQLYRISKLTKMSKGAGMTLKHAGKRKIQYVGEKGAKLTIKKFRNVLSPKGNLNKTGSWIQRAQLQVTEGTKSAARQFADPFSGKVGGLKSAAGHIPLEATISEAVGIGAAQGTTNRVVDKVTD